MSTLRFPTRPSDETCVEFYELKCIMPSTNTAAKFEHVIAEARFYSNEFKKLQDVTVPHFHELFMGEMMDEEDTACLVLDYIRESLSRCLWTMNAEFRHAALKTLRLIHHAGVQHNDLVERNIIVDENYRPFIIDFEIAGDINDKCGQVIPVIFNAKEPTCEEFGCEEMHDSCLIADVWQLRHVQFMHRYVPAEWATTPDELAMRAPQVLAMKKPTHQHWTE
ncbi:hypothetical protein A0H81_05260 [Grifola frondosa]|uniref:Protein kinase domain-containing protein n=1 Tax=Grifola frondosa TaxID=5627 RepID=A0A1C7MIJ2_GRIFR|nr:hypothetical protein A0H81_05260 [Grifola frondosa]